MTARRFEYDASARQLAIRLEPGVVAARARVEIAPGVLADYAEDGRITRLDVADIKNRTPQKIRRIEKTTVLGLDELLKRYDYPGGPSTLMGLMEELETPVVTEEDAEDWDEP